MERASAKAVRYAIMNWHYSKSIPMCQANYAFFNAKNDFCGVICFAIGANNNIAKPFGMNGGQVIELVRVALNGKQSTTSKSVSLALKFVKKDAPLAKLCVSYADTTQGHTGVLYQATNWFFIGESKDNSNIDPLTGEKKHRRTISSIYGTAAGAKACETVVKYKYIYPLDKSLIPMCKAMAKPYPKK